ncbi:MAG: glycoside hydrolase family 3 protein [Chloroflexota bacterium]
MTAESILSRVMLAFEGDRLPPSVEERFARAPVAGITTYLSNNVRSPGQLRELTDAVQAVGARAGWASGPLLIAADQEGGQLNGLGEGTTWFAGNMALGAVDDTGLTERVGLAIGREARAMGVNVVYAPVMDLASERLNTAMGTRSFGDDPALVGRHGAALVRGLQAAGAAATVKHFPGLGAATADTHHEVASVPGASDDLAPFGEAIAAGARMAMSAHVAVPSLTGHASLPATLSRAVMTDTLRGDLGFRGVSITDALDMRALAQGPAQAVDIIAAIRAGIDLMLASANPTALGRTEETLVSAAARGLFDEDEIAASSARLDELRAWLAAAGPAPSLDVVGGAEHRALSRELAERALTRIDDGPPIAWSADTRILAIMARPTELTPADTSGVVTPGLGRALRTRFASVEEVVVDPSPSKTDIAALRESASVFDAVVIGTIEAHRQPAQLALVRALAGTGRPLVAAALRTPWDCPRFPAGVPAVCTYSILPDPLDALARALAGDIGFAGRSPVAL